MVILLTPAIIRLTGKLSPYIAWAGTWVVLKCCTSKTKHPRSIVSKSLVKCLSVQTEVIDTEEVSFLAWLANLAFGKHLLWWTIHWYEEFGVRNDAVWQWMLSNYLRLWWLKSFLFYVVSRGSIVEDVFVVVRLKNSWYSRQRVRLNNMLVINAIYWRRRI